MVDVKENVADRCGGLGEGEGERPFLTEDAGVSLGVSLGVSVIVARTAFLN